MSSNNRVPPNPQNLARAAKLNAAAARMLAQGDPKLASSLLSEALELNREDLTSWLSLAAARSALNDSVGAMAALESVLSMDPRFFFGLLMKGSLQERSDPKAAAQTYGQALAQAPPWERLDEPTRRAVARAQEVNRRYRDELRNFVKRAIGADREVMAGSESQRIDLFIDATLGVKRIYPQQPTEYCYPNLPAIEFYDRAEFPWLAQLESATSVIQAELQEVIKSSEGFTPYIAYPDTVPLDQWAELNHSPRWSAFHFHHYGRRHEENCARCPNTLDILSRLPQPQVQGRMPAAMFSVLRAGTRIPAHTGVANVRLVVHLPLIVPPGCRFRVGNEVREWRVGDAWVFDDTIEHEAWNDSDRDRVILIFDVWSPRLSANERSLIGAVMAAMDTFNGISPESSL